MTIEKPEELDGLMDQAAYDKFIKSLDEWTVEVTVVLCNVIMIKDL